MLENSYDWHDVSHWWQTAIKQSSSMNRLKRFFQQQATVHISINWYPLCLPDSLLQHQDGAYQSQHNMF